MDQNSVTLRNASLQELVERLRAEQVVKRDLVLPASLLSMEGGMAVIEDVASIVGEANELADLLAGGGISLSGETERMILEPTKSAHGQIADICNIPRKYYWLLGDQQVDLLDVNVQMRMNHRGERTVLARTFKALDDNPGVLRAVLGRNYKVIDNLDILTTVLEVVKDVESEFGELIIDKCNLTEKQMFIQIVAPNIMREAEEILDKYRAPKRRLGGHNHEITGWPGGSHGICTGLVFGNSETGFGKWFVKPRAVVSICNNGWIDHRYAVDGVHRGKTLETGVMVEWSEETMHKELELIQLQVRDAARFYLSDDFLGKMITIMSEAASHELGSPSRTVEEICTQLNFSEERAESVFDYFIGGHDNTALGVSQALTFFAQEADDPALQYEIEQSAFALLPEIIKVDTALSAN